MVQSRHDFTYEAVCGMLDKIAIPFKRFIEKCSPVDLEHALAKRSEFMDLPPFDKFKCSIPNVEYTFIDDCRWWETRFGPKEGDRYAMLLFDEVSQMIEEQLERAKETDKPAKGDLAA